MTYRLSAIILILFFGSSWPAASLSAEDDRWGAFRFLIGAWVSEAKAETGSGRFTLEPDLQGKVLVRRNVTVLRTTGDAPSATHEDLMIIYQEPTTRQFHASYFDNEGHVIQYAITPLPDSKGLVFLSRGVPSEPQFRLTYIREKDEKVTVKFEIAPPGKAGTFRLYQSGTVRRTKRGE